MGSSNVNVNNVLSEMRNTVKQDPNDLTKTIPVLGRRVTVAGNTQVIDSVTPTLLDPNTTHIQWTVEVDDIFVTFDGSDPTNAASARHSVAAGNLGTLWHVELAKTARVAEQAGAPVFVISEMSKK